jgi:hypothetical protein
LCQQNLTNHGLRHVRRVGGDGSALANLSAEPATQGIAPLSAHNWSPGNQNNYVAFDLHAKAMGITREEFQQMSQGV